MTRTIITSALALAFLAGTTMAQPVPPGLDPARLVPLDVAVRGAIELCTDHSMASFRNPDVQGRIKKLGFESMGGPFRLKDPGPNPTDFYMMRAWTTDGVIAIRAWPDGSCSTLLSRTLYQGFSAGFDSSTGFVRDTTGLDPDVTSWRSQKAVATIRLQPRPALGATVSIAPVAQ